MTCPKCANKFLYKDLDGHGCFCGWHSFEHATDNSRNSDVIADHVVHLPTFIARRR